MLACIATLAAGYSTQQHGTHTGPFSERLSLSTFRTPSKIEQSMTHTSSRVRFVNIGGGLGIPYRWNEEVSASPAIRCGFVLHLNQPLNLSMVNEHIAKFKSEYPRVSYCLGLTALTDTRCDAAAGVDGAWSVHRRRVLRNPHSSQSNQAQGESARGRDIC